MDLSISSFFLGMKLLSNTRISWKQSFSKKKKKTESSELERETHTHTERDCRGINGSVKIRDYNQCTEYGMTVITLNNHISWKS